MKFLVLATAVLSVVCWVASETDNYKQTIEYYGKLCKARTNASDADIQVIANLKELTTYIQKVLAHCIYQKVKVFCGDFLNGDEYLYKAYCMVHDGDTSRFKNVTYKVESAYAAAKAFNDEDGPEAANAMYETFRKQ